MFITAVWTLRSEITLKVSRNAITIVTGENCAEGICEVKGTQNSQNTSLLVLNWMQRLGRHRRSVLLD